jgi:rod shape-determining protein MreD
MATLIALPLFSLLLIIQSAVLSRAPLVYGTADLTLLAMIAWALQKRVNTAWHWGIVGGLMASFISALPIGVPLLGYLLVVGLALMLRQRIWQAPILAMFLAVFVGTLSTHLLNLIALRLVGNPMPWLPALELITLPSLLLNLLLALPAYVIFADLAKWLYPEGLEM